MKLRLIVGALLSFSFVGLRAMEASVEAVQEDSKVDAAALLTGLRRVIVRSASQAAIDPKNFQAMVTNILEKLTEDVEALVWDVKAVGSYETDYGTVTFDQRMKILDRTVTSLVHAVNQDNARLKEINARLKEVEKIVASRPPVELAEKVFLAGTIAESAEKGFLAGTITESVVAGLNEHSGEIAIALMATAVAKGAYDYCTSPKKTNDSANALQPKTVPQKAWKAMSENRVVAGCVVTAVPFLINFARKGQS